MIEGIAVRYGDRAAIPNAAAPAWIEEILPGAFSDSLRSSESIRALVSHEVSKVLGGTRNGTLELADGQDALRFRLTPNVETSFGRDQLELVRRGDVSGMSFGFRNATDSWQTVNAGGEPVALRTVSRADLVEITLTDFPAYSKTDFELGVRSLEGWRGSLEVTPDMMDRIRLLRLANYRLRGDCCL